MTGRLWATSNERQSAHALSAKHGCRPVAQLGHSKGGTATAFQPFTDLRLIPAVPQFLKADTVPARLQAAPSSCLHGERPRTRPARQLATWHPADDLGGCPPALHMVGTERCSWNVDGRIRERSSIVGRLPFTVDAVRRIEARDVHGQREASLRWSRDRRASGRPSFA